MGLPKKSYKKNSDIVPELTTVLSFSGGLSSARMLSLWGNAVDHVIFANTGKEHPGTLDFVRDCEQHFNIPIVWVEYCPENKFKVVTYETASRKGEPFAALIKKRSYLPNVVTRFCTTELKIRPMKSYLKSIGVRAKDVEMMIGIRADEKSRYDRNKGIAKGIGWDRVMPLYEKGITKGDVNLFWDTMPFTLNINNYEGNCDLCFLKGKSKRLKVLQNNPSAADWWIEQEELRQNTFEKRVKVSELLHMAMTQTMIPFEDDDVDCYCTID